MLPPGRGVLPRAHANDGLAELVLNDVYYYAPLLIVLPGDTASGGDDRSRYIAAPRVADDHANAHYLVRLVSIRTSLDDHLEMDAISGSRSETAEPYLEALPLRIASDSKMPPLASC